MAKHLEKKHPLAVRWMHWINFPLLTLMIWSGMLIYWANPVYAIYIGNYELFKFFPPWFIDFFGTPFRLAEGKSTTWKITLTRTQDSRDKIFNTARGNYATLDMGVAGGPMGGDNHYYNLSSAARSSSRSPSSRSRCWPSSAASAWWTASARATS